MKVPWTSSTPLAATKHFHMKWMRRWGWDYEDLRDAIQNADTVMRVGKQKYELYTNKRGMKKIIVAFDGRIICITGSQGARRAPKED